MVSVITAAPASFTVRNADMGGHADTQSKKYDKKNDRARVLAQSKVIEISPSITRLAVELMLPDSHVSSATMEPLLHSVRHLLSLDSVFVALFDSAGTKIEWINNASIDYEHCNPYELLGSKQPCSIDLLNRLANHRLLEINDLISRDGAYASFKTQMTTLNLGSLLVGGIANAGRVVGLMVFGYLNFCRRWSADINLAMKLLSSCYAAGHERCQIALNRNHYNAE